MEYLGIADLRKKWIYCRDGVRKVRRRGDFPVPAFYLNDGRTPVWAKTDIAVYEDKHPELTDKEAKRRKMRSFAIGQLKKARGGA